MIKVLGSYGNRGRDAYTTAFLIRDDIVIDAGNLANGLGDDVNKIEHIFLTHSHFDHILDLPFVIDTNFENRKNSLKIYGLKETIDAIKTIFNNRIWPDFATIELLNGVATPQSIDEFRQRWVYVPTKVFANHSLLSEAVYVGFGSLDNLFPDKFEDPKERVKYLVYEGKEGRIRVPPYIKYIQRYSDFFRKNFGINPYTFRKAWENYIAKKVNPEFIAKYEGRVDLDTFLDYIREQESKNLIIPYIDI